jgi:hypothetical protein
VLLELAAKSDQRSRGASLGNTFEVTLRLNSLRMLHGLKQQKMNLEFILKDFSLESLQSQGRHLENQRSAQNLQSSHACSS